MVIKVKIKISYTAERKQIFAVIYRGYVKDGLELKYQNLWHKIATYFVMSRGALGSYLHKTEDGYWLAYSRWPDKATRDASWSDDSVVLENLPEDIRHAIAEIKTCIDQQRIFPEICMEVMNHIGSK